MSSLVIIRSSTDTPPEDQINSAIADQSMRGYHVVQANTSVIVAGDGPRYDGAPKHELIFTTTVVMEKK